MILQTPILPPKVKKKKEYESKTFYAIDFKEYKDAECNETIIPPYYPLKAYKIYEGEKCIIYVEDGHLEKVESEAEKIADAFDNEIYPLVTSNFGAAPDVDGNGKIYILFY